MAYRIDDAVYVGDTLLMPDVVMPDVGSARADFPDGNAGQLFRSIRRLLDFPSNDRQATFLSVEEVALEVHKQHGGFRHLVV